MTKPDPLPFTTRLLAATVLALAAAGPTAAQLAPVRVGFVCALSGGTAELGNSARHGAELAVAEINEVGGFFGRKLELVERDDHGDPAQGRRIAEELVSREKVAFTVGYCNSGVAIQATPVFEAAHSVLMVPVATATAVTAAIPARDSYVFRMTVRDVDQAAFMVDEAVGRSHHTKVAILADNTGFGAGGLRDLQTFLAARGSTPVYVGRFDVGTTSMAEDMRQIKAKGADVILGYTYGPEFAAILRSRAEAGVAAPVYGSQPMALGSVADRAGPASNGAMVPSTIIHDLSNERRSSFIARLGKAAKPDKVSALYAAAQTYDAVHLMLRAMFQTQGDLSGAALKAALEHLNSPYRGVITTHTHPFSPDDHDAFTRNMMWLGQWKNGEIVFAHDADARRSSVLRVKSTR